MPLYNFRNKDTDEVEEHFVSMTDLDQFLVDNAHLVMSMQLPNIIGGLTTEGGKLPEGFKDTLREMKKKHPHGKGINQV